MEPTIPPIPGSNPPPDPGSPALVRVPAKSASEVCLHADLGPEILALGSGLPPRQFLDGLLAGKLYPEAVRFLAYALPRREAIWWGCLVVLHLGGTHLAGTDALALHAAARWVVEPGEPHRHEAEPLARLDTPGGCLAQAVAWTGGNMIPAPPGLPEPARKAWSVPPPPQLSHQAVDAAVALAVVTGPPRQTEERFRHALALGIHVARGHHLWQPAHPH